MTMAHRAMLLDIQAGAVVKIGQTRTSVTIGKQAPHITKNSNIIYGIHILYYFISDK
jgi:hypothetical protein